MENEMIQDVMENNETVAEKVYETYPIDEVMEDDGSDLKEKLIKGGIFAAGAAAGAITTKVVIPAGKKAFGWAKEHWPFGKKKSEDAEESETEAKEKEEKTEEAEVEDKKPDNNNHKKEKKRK